MLVPKFQKWPGTPEWPVYQDSQYGKIVKRERQEDNDQATLQLTILLLAVQVALTTDYQGILK
jgi:hypothetical protein